MTDFKYDTQANFARANKNSAVHCIVHDFFQNIVAIMRQDK